MKKSFWLLWENIQKFIFFCSLLHLTNSLIINFFFGLSSSAVSNFGRSLYSQQFSITSYHRLVSMLSQQQKKNGNGKSLMVRWVKIHVIYFFIYFLGIFGSLSQIGIEIANNLYLCLVSSWCEREESCGGQVVHFISSGINKNAWIYLIPLIGSLWAWNCTAWFMFICQYLTKPLWSPVTIQLSLCDQTIALTDTVWA